MPRTPAELRSMSCAAPRGTSGGCTWCPPARPPDPWGGVPRAAASRWLAVLSSDQLFDNKTNKMAMGHVATCSDFSY
jgi:hypothetical protein